MLVKAEIKNGNERISMWVFNMDDKQSRHDFAIRANAALRRGLVVTTRKTDTTDLVDHDEAKIRWLVNRLLAVGILIGLGLVIVLVALP